MFNYFILPGNIQAKRKQHFILPFLFLLSAVSFAQLSSIFIMPNTVDTTYSTNEDSIFVTLNTSAVSNNKLLVFFPGTGAKTKHYQLFPNLAANLGYHAIGLPYPNGYPTLATICAGNADTNCYYNYRQEVCYGTNTSSNVTVDSLNSIRIRLIKTLQYLSVTYPTQGWGQFLNGNNPDWPKIALAGHSQGGGHALYLAKTNTCDRMIMISGADDYSDYYSKPANWIYYLSSQTPLNKFFSFLHLNDDVWAYSKQFAVVTALGMTVSDDSTIVDNQVSPYSGSHCLYTALTPLYPGVYSAEHNGPVVDFYTPKNSGVAVYNPVWTYMLTSGATSGLNKYAVNNDEVLVYPNPANYFININYAGRFSAQIYDAWGRQLYSANGQDSQLKVNCTDFARGVYTLRLQNQAGNSFYKKIVIK